MKTTNNFIFPLLLMGTFLLFASSCKKGNGDDGINGNGTTLTEGTFIDTRDSNVYKYVTIGEQVWMAENLRYLPKVVGSGMGLETTPYIYVYDYDGNSVEEAKATANYTTYGVLYNWLAAMNKETSSEANPSGIQGVCPEGWHLPSQAEWQQLIDFLGGEEIAGGKLKEAGTTHWISPNEGATNETGFTALPGGYRGYCGMFKGVGNMGFWWSATAQSSIYAWTFSMIYDYGQIYSNYYIKEDGFSVRCVKTISN
ncbi:MAG TPA: FISUMP domain-containing protein [Salinivirgaceae bacterium]|nr:FISUMP domain-containing protein [Salinivirgaceae bacterium]HQA76271.1 FISUMP domain-containing protein [Salinivirgaceae bacterium]